MGRAFPFPVDITVCHNCVHLTIIFQFPDVKALLQPWKELIVTRRRIPRIESKLQWAVWLRNNSANKLVLRPVIINVIRHFGFYLTEKTVHVHYKDQSSGNIVQINNCFLLPESYIHCVGKRRKFLNAEASSSCLL